MRRVLGKQRPAALLTMTCLDVTRLGFLLVVSVHSRRQLALISAEVLPPVMEPLDAVQNIVEFVAALAITPRAVRM